MLVNIFCIVIGILFALIGLIATIIAFGCLDPIDHIWSVPLLILGIVIVYICGNNIVEIKVNERIQQYNLVGKVSDR